MTLDELLEQFDEVLDSGIKIPGKKTVVDIEKLRAVVDDIRLIISSWITAGTKSEISPPIPAICFTILELKYIF